MSAQLRTRHFARTFSIAVPFAAAILAFSGPARAAPVVTASEAAAIAVARLPHCSVTDLSLYYDEDAPMWFVETECTDETWQDLRIDGITGRVVAINGDYDV